MSAVSKSRDCHNVDKSKKERVVSVFTCAVCITRTVLFVFDSSITVWQCLAANTPDILTNIMLVMLAMCMISLSSNFIFVFRKIYNCIG